MYPRHCVKNSWGDHRSKTGNITASLAKLISYTATSVVIDTMLLPEDGQTLCSVAIYYLCLEDNDSEWLAKDAAN